LSDNSDSTACRLRGSNKRPQETIFSDMTQKWLHIARTLVSGL
jgi:hypothetical protein